MAHAEIFIYKMSLVYIRNAEIVQSYVFCIIVVSAAIVGDYNTSETSAEERWKE